jgi:DNA-binding response OmpR family regulator
MADRILIIDDEVSTLKLLGMALEKEGFEIGAAQDAKRALTEIEATPPDLIILDVMLPDVSGLELCRVFRQRPGMATTPILMLSAKGDVDDRIAGLEAGADEYIVKPVDVREMTVRVKSLLERTRRLAAAAAPRAGMITTLVGSKGGIGTTTLLVNLGVALASRQLATSAVELRPYPGSLSILTGAHTPKDLSELLAMPAGSITAQEVERHLTQHASGLKALCAPQELRDDLVLSPEHATAILDGLSQSAEHVLVDLPASPAPTSRLTLQRSAGVLLLVQPVRDSLVAAKRLAQYVSRHVGAGTSLGIVIANLAPIASPISHDEIRQAIEWEIVGSLPPAADLCALAQLKGIPFTQMQPDSVLSQAVFALARRFE